MQPYEDNLRTALENAITRERLARRRSIVYTFIPILMAAVLIGVTWSQVSSATKQLNDTKQQLSEARTQLQTTNNQLTEAQENFTTLQAQLKQAQTDITSLKTQLEQYKLETEQLKAERDALQKEVEELKKTIDELGQQVEDAQGLKRYEYDVNLNLVLKSLFDERVFQLLMDIWRMQPESEKKWHLGGIGPDEFDSPGFAVYMLNTHGALPGDNEKNHYELIKILPPTDSPTDGDIIFYEKGYTMFYFWDHENNQPFVIGMTPLGIVTLKFDFAPIRMIGHVTYPSP